ncbi:MAG TPA: IclR family transcriptional regulator [Candidatus Lustribacter sp.]|jgi:DNA-binding IclR family transcriptional regulator|nr:IclR family transcriptional regulator [Candidatus Lustribacter sp.]
MPESDSHGRMSPVRRALRILDLFTPEAPVWGISEIARQMQLPKSNVARLIADLRSEGYVVRDERRRYRLGMHVHGLGGGLLYNACLPGLIELRRRTGMSAHLAVLDGIEVVHVERLRSDRMFAFIGGRTLQSPIHATCTGKALVAFAPEATRERAIAAGLPRYSNATITDAAAFRSELARIREDGFALDREEYMPGLCACAAPVFQRDGSAVAAIAVVGDARILSDGQRSRTINLVKAIAGTIAPPSALA